MEPVDDGLEHVATEGDENEMREELQRLHLQEVPRTDPAEDQLLDGLAQENDAPVDEQQRVVADETAQDDEGETVALYGHELAKVRDRVSRWRAMQVKEAFRIGDIWSKLSDKLSAQEISAFLESECQIPRRDVTRYVRLSATFTSEARELLVEHGVAVSVLLELAGQDETVRGEAIRMIDAGRSLQSKDLRGLKRDIGLVRDAQDGKLDERRARDFKNAAARKARGVASAWLASLESLTNEVIELSELDRTKSVANDAPDRVSQLAAMATKLLSEFHVIAGADFPTRAARGENILGHGSWVKVEAALSRIARGDVFIAEHYQRPLTTVLAFDHYLVWDLAWVFGHDEDARPEATLKRMRESKAVPLDTSAEPGRLRAEVVRAPTVLEICAGAGGEALGLDAAGFHHVGLVEIDRDAAATLRANRPAWPVIQGDLRGLDLKAYKGVDLLAGGVPCQPYSAAGERRGADDERDLFPEALRLVRQLKPKAVMLENVTGALHVSNSVNRLRILSELTSLGYDAEWRILEGLEFGLPQNRRRAILVGFQPGIMHRFRWPKALETPVPTVGEALRDLMAAKGWPHVDQWVTKANGHAPTLIGGSQKKMGIDLAQAKSRESWIKLGVNPSGRAKSAPGPDAPADHLPKLTLAMMARIQDFPDDWKFQGSDLQVFRQIANAFPPRMAHAVGASMIRALSGSEIDLSAAFKAPGHTRGRLNLALLRKRSRSEDVDEMA